MATNEKNRFQGQVVTVQYLWMKGVIFEAPHKLHFSLPRKCIQRAVDRNRLRRWARLEWQKNGFKTGGFVIFLRKEGAFYRYLKRRDFNHVFYEFIKKLKKQLQQQRTQAKAKSLG